MNKFPFPLLLCDVGGTNARFHWSHAEDSAPVSFGHLLTDQFATWPEALRAILPTCPERPASLLVCAAGPIANRAVALTNCGWFIDGARTAIEFGFSQGLLLNDFEALAFALPGFLPEDIEQIGAPASILRGDGVRAILGPGTGLGVGALLTNDGRHLVMASEGGHVALAPADEEEAAIFALAEKPCGRLSAETILSGPGLARLHKARLRHFQRIDAMLMDPSQINASAMADPNSAEAETVRHFWRIIASFAGDMALALGARQGVTLAGGVLPKLRGLLDVRAFREAFEKKAPMQNYCRATPTALLTNPAAPILAMHAIAAMPTQFKIDYGARCWR